MERTQVIRKSSRLSSLRQRIFHMESIVKMGGSGILTQSCWYDPQVYGKHLNRFIGFSTDFLQDDSLELAWRPHQMEGVFEIFAYMRKSGKWIRQTKEQDMITVVQKDVPFFFRLHHYIPESENPEDYCDENRLASFCVNGYAQVRHYGAGFTWGWIRNFRSAKPASKNMEAKIEFTLNQIHD